MEYLFERIEQMLAEKRSASHDTNAPGTTATILTAAAAAAATSVDLTNSLTGCKRKATLSLSGSVEWETAKKAPHNHHKASSGRSGAAPAIETSRHASPQPPSDENSFDVALCNVLQHCGATANSSVPRVDTGPVPGSVLRHLSQCIDIELSQNTFSASNTASASAATTSCSHCLNIFIVRNPAANASDTDYRPSVASCAQRLQSSVASRENSVEVMKVFTLDEAFEIIIKNQDAKRDYNRDMKVFQVKYECVDSTAVSSAPLSSPSSDHPAPEQRAEGAGAKVKMNRKMRRLLSGKSRSVSNEKSDLTCLDEVMINKARAPTAESETSKPDTRQEELHLVYEHYVILLPLPCVSTTGGGAGASNDPQRNMSVVQLREHHNICFVPQTLQDVSTAARIDYLSSIHICPLPQHLSPPPSPPATLPMATHPVANEAPPNQESTGGRIEVAVHPHAGVMLSNLQNGKSNKRKCQSAHMSMTNMHFRHEVLQQTGVDDIDTESVAGGPPLPGTWPKSTCISARGKKNKNSSFICAKGPATSIVVSSCQFDEVCGPIAADTVSLSKSAVAASAWDTKRKYNVSTSSKESKNLFSALTGSHVRLEQVVIISPSLSCGVFASGKSHLTLQDCCIADIAYGCGIQCEAGSGLDLLRCTVRRCGSSGLFARNALYMRLQECTIHSNGRCGVEIFTCSRGAAKEISVSSSSTATQLPLPLLGQQEQLHHGIGGARSAPPPEGVSISLQDLQQPIKWNPPPQLLRVYDRSLLHY